MASDSNRAEAGAPRRVPIYSLPGVSGEVFTVPLAGSTHARAVRAVKRWSRGEEDNAALLAMLGLDSPEHP